MPLDAIPDLSDAQVIIYTEFPGQAPQVVEDQVTYPLTTAMLTVPKSRVVRGFSYFGVSFVYVIFEEGTDVYWARSRVLEYLSSAARRLPQGVTPSLGPTPPGLAGSINMVRGAQRSLAELRTIQDWYSASASNASGVAEVASVGGFVKQYSVVIDPRRLQALGIPLAHWRGHQGKQHGCRRPHLEVSETRVRRARPRLYQEPVRPRANRGQERGRRPVLLKDVARVELTSDERRGITEMDGEGEVGGIALQRSGENALGHRQRQTEYRRDRAEPARRRERRGGLRPFVSHLPRYRHVEAHADRGEPDCRAVCVIFLLHARSALVAIITLPLGILIAYICMWALG